MLTSTSENVNSGALSFFLLVFCRTPILQVFNSQAMRLQIREMEKLETELNA